MSIESGNPGDALHPQIAIDAGGNAIAVWVQPDGTRVNVWANRYAAGSGWSTPQMIGRADARGADKPQVVFDVSGNAIAVWQHFDGNVTSIATNRYTVPGGWGSAQLLETDDAKNAFEPQIAVDAAGNAIAVWTQSDGALVRIRANRYAAGAGWGSAQALESGDLGDSRSPQVAVGANGTAVVVWAQSGPSGRTNILANRYVAGAGWEVAQLIDLDTRVSASPEVAIGANGDATAVWEKSDGTRTNIWARHLKAGANWSAPTLIEADNSGDAFNPRVASDAGGNAVAVWALADGGGSRIWAGHYTAGMGWGAPQLIETGNTDLANSIEPQIAIGADGSSAAVWERRLIAGRSDVWTARHAPDVGWGAAQLLETDDAGNASGPQISTGPGGSALAVWAQESSDGIFSILANAFH